MGVLSVIGQADMLVDSVGIKIDAFTSVDRFGTPQSELMHVIERYRLIDGTLAKTASDKYAKAEGIVAGNRQSGADPDMSVKGLQIELTIEDPNVFTAPLMVSKSHTGGRSGNGRNRSAPRIRSSIIGVSGSACPGRSVQISDPRTPMARVISRGTHVKGLISVLAWNSALGRAERFATGRAFAFGDRGTG
jgi:hypothetical protein